MDTKYFLLFPGQGAQSIGMARDAYDAGGYAHALFEEASEILGFDLAAMVFESDDATLAKTENCQPALLVASYALLQTLRERCEVEVSGAAGLSLGEYTALLALDVMDFADAVRLVRRRGELMEEAGRGRDTGMSSIIGLSGEQVDEICRQASDVGLVVPANFNCPGQVAISGEKPAVQKAGELAKNVGAKRVMPLNVSAAFHSPVMESARKGLSAVLADVPLRRPASRFISNVDAEWVTSADDIREGLARQLVSSVRWEQSMQKVLAEGETQFLEVGPGTVLKGLMRRISSDVKVTSIGSLKDMDALAEA